MYRKETIKRRKKKKKTVHERKGRNGICTVHKKEKEKEKNGA